MAGKASAGAGEGKVPCPPRESPLPPLEPVYGGLANECSRKYGSEAPPPEKRRLSVPCPCRLKITDACEDLGKAKDPERVWLRAQPGRKERGVCGGTRHCRDCARQACEFGCAKLGIYHT